MSKIEKEIINTINRLASDMEMEATNKKYKACTDASITFYTLFRNHLLYSKDNINYFSRDRLIINNKYIKEFYSTLYMFDLNISLDDLKEYKKLYSKTSSRLDNKVFLGTNHPGENIAFGVGISLGERYLSKLLDEKYNSNILNFNTYVVCDSSDFLSGLSLETLELINKERLNKLTIIILNNDDEVDLYKMINQYNFNIVEVKGNSINNIDEAIDDATSSSKPSIVIINKVKDKNEEIVIKERFEVDNELIKNINNTVQKRLAKFNDKINSNDKNTKLFEILNNRVYDINFNSDNIKLNDNYEEELSVGNEKIFNIFASKSPFVLSLSNEKKLIHNDGVMSKDNIISKNILMNNIYSLGFIANGISSVGLKVFVSTPLINVDILKSSIKYASKNNLDVTYIFSNDTFLDSYYSNLESPIDEIDSLREISNFTIFRPADINEILGIYNILTKYNKPSAILVGNTKSKKLIGTNPKYVVAGMYRVKKEKEKLDGIIISSGAEVNTALKISEDLYSFGIDTRVISAPSLELFRMQNEKYKSMLIPNDVKTFTLEYSTSYVIDMYATSKDFVIRLDDYPKDGLKSELLKDLELDLDSIERRIVEKLKK